MLHYYAFQRVDEETVSIFSSLTGKKEEHKDISIRQAVTLYNIRGRVISIYEIIPNVGNKKELIVWWEGG